MSLLSRLSAYGKVLQHESMRKHTTYRIGGTVDYYISPDCETSLMCIIELLVKNNVPYFILGRGSNLLFDDNDFHGAVINLDAQMNEFWQEPDGTLVAQAGCSIIHLASQAAAAGLSGLEFASGIPGSIGGALYMNAGAYNSDFSEILKDVCVLRDGKICWIAKEDLDYSYRHSAFQQHKDWTILAGRFQLEKRDSAKIYERMDSRRKRRIETQPLSMPCAGSVFRNPPQIPAWKIIEQLGFRGAQIGGAKVSEKHCNFIVNETGEARAKDVLDLIHAIQFSAKKFFDVDLILEVEYLTWESCSF